MEIRKLEQKIKDQKRKISIFESQFQNNLDSLKLTFKNTLEFDYDIQNIKTRIHRSESFCDNTRDKKLKALINNRLTEFSTVEIHNLTSITILSEILDIFKSGNAHAIKGSPRGSNNF